MLVRFTCGNYVCSLKVVTKVAMLLHEPLHAWSQNSSCDCAGSCSSSETPTVFIHSSCDLKSLCLLAFMHLVRKLIAHAWCTQLDFICSPWVLITACVCSFSTPKLVDFVEEVLWLFLMFTHELYCWLRILFTGYVRSFFEPKLVKFVI